MKTKLMSACKKYIDRECHGREVGCGGCNEWKPMNQNKNIEKQNEVAILRKLPVGHALAIREYRIGSSENCSQIVTADALFNESEPCSNLYVLAGHYLLMKQQLEEAQAKLDKTLELIKDFRDFGTRHDTHPTGQFMPCGCFNSFEGDYWQGYLRSMDNSVRTRATELLAQEEFKEKKK